MRKNTIAACAYSMALLTSVVASALVMRESRGSWPGDWPKPLEALRSHARTIKVANGIQENIYEITFSDRDQFEKAWPSILAVKTPGAPLRLYGIDKIPGSGFGANLVPLVRIYGPSEGEAIGKDGQRLKASPPWPRDLRGPNGELPEFVGTAVSVDGKLRWVAVDPQNDKDLGFHDRARVDLELVVDGKIIDLNRVGLPKGTPIEDHRFK